jgi:predicted  nucleic acid-binding Zn-ribbon protein
MLKQGEHVSKLTHPRQKLAQTRSYHSDFYSWAHQQASLLKHLQSTRLDWQNLIEEIMAAARSEERELTSRLQVLLTHLLKWRYEPARRGGSWRATILNARDEIDELMERSPSLKNEIDRAFRNAYRRARREAGGEMNMDQREWEAKLPAECEWTLERVRDPDFWPG